jgi:hypothetical protein
VDDRVKDDGITDERWQLAIERRNAYLCPECGRRNIATWIGDNIPCLDAPRCPGRYRHVEVASEEVA